MARAQTVALALFLSACGAQDSRAPFVDSQTPPSLAARFYPPEGWAWGLVRAGTLPPQRYGVASPPRVPRAQVLILPGEGESAEVWFETARDLTARGATVWILERAGQAGSARYSAPRDIVDAPSLDADVAGLRAMRDTVIRPGSDAPLIVLAGADAAAPALLAAAQGLAMDGLILSAPRLGDRGAAATQLQAAAVRLGLGALPAPGRRRWTRDGPDGVALGLTHDPWRGRVADAWRLANPDLRVSGVSLRWQAAFASAGRQAWRDAGDVKTPVLALAAQGDAPTEALCRRLPRCALRSFPGARPALHLAVDRVRGPWLDAVTRAVFGARGPAPLDPPPT